MTSEKRIVCTDQVPLGNAPECARIVAVGVSTDGASVANEHLNVPAVVQQLRLGIVFYTYDSVSGKVAFVESYWCSQCQREHIRSAADAVLANNLDSLRYCDWKKAV